MARAIVLGAYGLIGARCCRALLDAGFDVTGIGRDPAAARQTGLPINWIFRDIAHTPAKIWQADLAGSDVVVNCAGALQDGLRDDLAAIHDGAIAAMTEALNGTSVRFIQISAAGAAADAGTEFMRSKARGDARLMASGLDWVVLRPVLVIAPSAYGGTALLRAAAGFPLIFPRVLPDAPVQTVFVDDVADAVVMAAQGRIAPRTLAELTEPGRRSFAGTVLAFRNWLGLPPWRFVLNVPRPLLLAAARIADIAGWLGWRSPLRTSAVQSIEAGVTADPASWARAGGAPMRGLDQTLAAIPSTAQERWFSRMFLMLPLSIGVLAVFWAASGLIALAQPERTATVLSSRGVSYPIAMSIAVIGGLADLALGCALLIRRWTARAALGMAGLALVYLLGSLAIAPDLWTDPMGPMLKVLPSIPLALIVAALAAER